MYDEQDTRGNHVWACLVIADDDAQSSGFTNVRQLSAVGLGLDCSKVDCAKCVISQLCDSDGINKRSARWASFKYHAARVE